jgi:Tol biopolymer transport system component
MVLGTIGPRMNSILDPAISPDGQKVAVRGRLTQGETDHLYVLEGGDARRLTSNEGAERHMIYTPDGRRIAYSIQNTGGVSNLYLRAADGSGQDQPLIVSEGLHKWYPSFTPDASAIVFHTNSPNTEVRDLGYLVIASGETGVLVGDNGIQALARISRDGRFVAYQSDQDGRAEIYVTTFPKSDARWKVSTNGGTWPKWSNNELFYWEGNNQMAVSFTAEGSTFRPGTPRRLFTGAQAGMGADTTMSSYNPEYDVSADGTRFVVTQRP